MTSNSLTSMVTDSLWANVVFAFILAFLMFALTYQHLLPYHATPNKHAPRSLHTMLLSTAASLFVACVLNALYSAQEVPNGGSSLHIHNLTLGGWIAIMVFATITRAIPFTLLFLTFIAILESRWEMLILQVTRNKSRASSKVTFLGWHWKTRASYFQAAALLILPTASSITSAIGVASSTSAVLQDGSVDLQSLVHSSPVLKLAMAFDGMRCAFVAIGVLDIGICAFLLFKKLRAARYVDPVIDLTLLIFTPLLAILTLPTVIASSFHTAGVTSALSLAGVDFAALLVSNVVTVVCVIGLSILNNSSSWWTLAVLVSLDEEFAGHELTKAGTSHLQEDYIHSDR